MYKQLNWAMSKIKKSHRDLYNTILYSPDVTKEAIDEVIAEKKFSLWDKFCISSHTLSQLMWQEYSILRHAHPYLVLPDIVPNLNAISVRPYSSIFMSFSGVVPQRIGSENALTALSKCFVIPFNPRIGSIAGYQTDDEVVKHEFLASLAENEIMMLQADDFVICDNDFWMDRLKDVDPVAYDRVYTKSFCVWGATRRAKGQRWPYRISNTIGRFLGYPLRPKNHPMRLEKYQLDVLGNFEEKIEINTPQLDVLTRRR